MINEIKTEYTHTEKLAKYIYFQDNFSSNNIEKNNFIQQ